jgi:AraC family transcriptional regulator of adaptative response/methylated-DNA-[protein]-cysteine methyltransferase
MATDRGLCGLAFSDGNDDAALSDMVRRWPNAHYVRNEAMTLKHTQTVFDPKAWSADRPLHIVMIGTDFQVKVWQTLLKIPMGKAVRYGDIAQDIGKPSASRAVGAAVGANPISFVIPCHRAVGSTGALTGYHWGLTRKRAILGWEAGQVVE